MRSCGSSTLSGWRGLVIGALVAFPVLLGRAAPRATDFKEAAPGVAHFHDRIRSGPLSVHIVRMDRTQRDLTFMPLLGNGSRIGLATLTTQLRFVPKTFGRPVAAINGDFYKTEGETFPGDPRGLFVSRGELVSAPSGRAVFWIDGQNAPHLDTVESSFQVTWPIGQVSSLGLNEVDSEDPAVLFSSAVVGMPPKERGLWFMLDAAGETPLAPLRLGTTFKARLTPGTPPRGRVEKDRPVLWVSPGAPGARSLQAGSVIQVSFETLPALKGLTLALGGGPVLVREGRVQKTNTNKAGERHPRSALGWNATHYFLVTIDGRQPGLSVGVTLPELAAYLRDLGCTDATNLDGGGSTELWLNGEVINNPCYGHERETATSLVVVRIAETAANPGGASTPRPVAKEN